MLVLEFEPDGLTILDQNVKGMFNKLEYKPITFATLREIVNDGKTPPSQDVNFIDFSFKGDMLESTYVPAKDEKTFPLAVEVINTLFRAKHMPFKTIVVDTVTGLSSCILSHQAVVNSAALADPRKWAGNVGAKVSQVIDYLIAKDSNGNDIIQAHIVFIFHTDVEKDEDTKKMGEYPLMFSKERQSIHRKFSQFFYQENDTGKPQIWTIPFEYRKGVGARWPTLPAIVDPPTFNNIYGAVPDILK